jgi:hypothetical protein
MQEISKYFITEEEYFEYYQNANDPTFEMYDFNKNQFRVVNEKCLDIQNFDDDLSPPDGIPCK